MAHRISSLAEPAPGSGFLEVLVAVFSVRETRRGERIHVLMWQRAREPDAGKWALPGGMVLASEDVDTSASRQLADKVDLTRVAHLEQIGVFSTPRRIPERRVVATGFLGLVPFGSDPSLPADTAWHPVHELPVTAFDHGGIVDRAHRRLQAKLSYTNIAFALAPAEFTIAQLRRIYAAALDHDVDPTNLHRILSRRSMLERTGRMALANPVGGRPAALHRFTVAELRVTDPFAAFRPPDPAVEIPPRSVSPGRSTMGQPGRKSD